MDHLIDITSLSDEDIRQLLDDAEWFSQQSHIPRLLKRKVIVNLFYEPSTRTRLSFEMAAKRMGAEVINFAAQSSSVVKGESLIDTFLTVQAMQPDAIVIRHSKAGSAALLASQAKSGLAIINAGDGTNEHPSQALLDGLTIKQHFGRFEGLRVVIAGDTRHSRVATSTLKLLSRLGVESIRLCGPQQLLPAAGTFPGVELSEDLDAALHDADVIILLRIQAERINDSSLPAAAQYNQHWGMTIDRLGRLPRQTVIMHPGPMNRGVEIDSEAAESSRSLIQRQVRNGVFIRMAVLRRLLCTDEGNESDWRAADL